MEQMKRVVWDALLLEMNLSEFFITPSFEVYDVNTENKRCEKCSVCHCFFSVFPVS